MTLRFRLAQILFVIGLVAGLAVTTTARNDDGRSKDARKSGNAYDRYDRYEDDRYDNRKYNDRDDDRRDDDRDYDRDKDRDRDDRDHDRDDRDHDRDDDDDDDDRPHHGKKVTICHKDDHRFGGKTITVSWSAVAAHQRHGDTLGSCPVSKKK